MISVKNCTLDGDKHANCHNPTRYVGKITGVHANGTYDIRYDDGEEEYEVKAELIKPAYAALYKEGDAVEARYQRVL